MSGAVSFPRRRLEEIVKLAEADPLYGVSRWEAMRRAATRVAEKYGRSAGEEKGGKQRESMFV